MSEQPGYHNLDELKTLSLEELQALWELVPTERQKAYRTAYDREVRNAGALGSDALEQQVATELLRRYEDTALVPVGTRWARTPARVQEAARDDDSLDDADSATARPSKSPPKTVLVFGMLAVMLAGFMLLRMISGNGSAGSGVDVTPQASHTPTPEVSPTPTPLALEAQDDVIEGGDPARAVAYPVNLQVILPDGGPPRVWVVQRREVRAAQWHYDPNPDIASFINGMSVRPVIGIPWSVDNAAWFASMAAGARFSLTMNTGAILHYEFAAATQVRRSDSDIFRQVGPGLVLLLIGETDADGLPSATRTLVTATYPPEQELGRIDELISFVSSQTTPEPLPTPTATATLVPFTEVDVQVISVTTSPGRLTARLRIYNGGGVSQRFTPDDIWLALGFAPNPPGPRIPAEGMQPFDLLPEQAADVTLTWYWDDEPYAALQAGEWRFVIHMG
jgi:hypothetical protein